MNVTAWRKTFCGRMHIHVAFVLLLVTAYACYAIGMHFGAGMAFAAGWVLELVSWLLLAIGTSREDSKGRRGGLR